MWNQRSNIHSIRTMVQEISTFSTEELKNELQRREEERLIKLYGCHIIEKDVNGKIFRWLEYPNTHTRPPFEYEKEIAKSMF